MTTTTQYGLKKEVDCCFSEAAQTTVSSWPLLCGHLTILGPPRPCADVASPHPAPFLVSLLALPLPLGLFIIQGRPR